MYVEAAKYGELYLGLGSCQNSGVGCKGNNRVVKESTSRVADMNCEGFSDT